MNHKNWRAWWYGRSVAQPQPDRQTRARPPHEPHGKHFADADLNTILSSFPDNLFGVYSRFLKRIRPKAVFYVSTVLRWLAFSSQPVTMVELEDTLAFKFSSTSEFVYDPTRRGENADRVCKMLAKC
jgi:hypothetical protein